jgi:hypothetical protein
VTRARAVLLAAVAVAGLAAALGAFAERSPSAPPDPQDAVLDGCGRDYLRQTQRQIPTWVYVNDHDYPATGPTPPSQWLIGRVNSRYSPDLASHPTEEDLPPIHRAYDFNFNVLPDRAYRDLLGGDPAAHTGNYAGHNPSTARIHVEREQAALPRFAWPDRGDRVALLGSWVWDCGHWTNGGERTEIHSYRGLWVVRHPGGSAARSPSGEAEGDLVFSNDKTYAGIEADCAHRTKGSVPLFEGCLLAESGRQDVGGVYHFTLPLPHRPSKASRLRVRVLDAGSSGARAQVTTRLSGALQVTVRVPSGTAPLLVAKRVLAGWSGAPAPEHLRVRFTRLLVRRAMDPGCPNGRSTCGSKETTHGEQVSYRPGEWNVYLDADGIWTVWGSGLLQARDGQAFRSGPTLDVYVPRGRPWRLFAFARECDWGSLGNAGGPGHAMSPCPRSSEVGTFDGDDRAGAVVNRFPSPDASLGVHHARPTRMLSTCPPVNRLGCWQLDYVVTRSR